MAETLPSVGVLTEQERAKFDRDGYLIFDPEVPDSVLDAIVSDVADLYEGDDHLVDGVMYSANRIMDAWRISDNVKALATAPKVLAALQEVYGKKPLPFQTLNFPFGTEQSIHSDAFHFNSMPAGYMCGVWVAMEDIDMDNGPLIYYPGSHKLHEVTVDELGCEPGMDDYWRFEEHLDKVIADNGLEPAYGMMEKGQALLWASNLLHGGAPRNDPSRSRLSQVTHYFFEGTKYYTPLLSSGDDIHWRDPIWID